MNLFRDFPPLPFPPHPILVPNDYLLFVALALVLSYTFGQASPKNRTGPSKIRKKVFNEPAHHLVTSSSNVLLTEAGAASSYVTLTITLGKVDL